jgi:hypothetical protein
LTAANASAPQRSASWSSFGANVAFGQLPVAEEAADRHACAAVTGGPVDGTEHDSPPV